MLKAEEDLLKKQIQLSKQSPVDTLDSLNKFQKKEKV